MLIRYFVSAPNPSTLMKSQIVTIVHGLMPSENVPAT